MSEFGPVYITLGLLLLLGLATDLLGRRTSLPRVTLLLLFGFLLGQSGFDVLPASSESWFPLIADLALLMVGFLMGGKLGCALTPDDGKIIFWVSLSEVIVTAGVVLAGLILLGAPLAVALLLAGVATATDPAATSDVVQENHARGRFTNTLIGVVAIDDAWGLIVFSIVLAVAESLTGTGAILPIVLHTGWELSGAVLLGLALGVPMAFLSGRIRPGQPTLVEALGMVLLTGGLAQWLQVSFLLSAMVLGITVARLAKHHERPFHAIEDIEWPFMILFFVLAGAALQWEALLNVGLFGVAYIVLRIGGRLLGSWPGGALVSASGATRRWLGLALLPQAGVAMGMALIASQRFPQYADLIFPVVIGATVLFEMIGPIGTRIALFKAGDLAHATAHKR